jgi:hypothetical protein
MLLDASFKGLMPLYKTVPLDAIAPFNEQAVVDKVVPPDRIVPWKTWMHCFQLGLFTMPNPICACGLTALTTPFKALNPLEPKEHACPASFPSFSSHFKPHFEE